MDPREIPDPGRSVEELTLEELAVRELRRRLVDPLEARRLANTGLLNLVVAFQKQKEPDKPESEEVELDLLEILEQADLPEDRKRELIVEELEQLEQRRLSLSRVLEVDDGEEE